MPEPTGLDPRFPAGTGEAREAQWCPQERPCPPRPAALDWPRIGTALEGGQPAHVFGHEHYAEDLEVFGCAGVPINDPLSGKTIGAVDLTCWRKDADALLVALAKTTADQITSNLIGDSTAREFRLMQEYLRACRHTSGIVLALSADVVMMNDCARQVLDPADQVAVLGHATEALASGRQVPVTVTLPTGARARVQCRSLAEV